MSRSNSVFFVVAEGQEFLVYWASRSHACQLFLNLNLNLKFIHHCASNKCCKYIEYLLNQIWGDKDVGDGYIGGKNTGVWEVHQCLVLDLKAIRGDLVGEEGGEEGS